MPFVLLDDPLQSLDDVNALGFADLCRHIRRQRQLIVSTHAPRLAALLERKLAPRTEHERTRVVEFKAWTRRGPNLEQRSSNLNLWKAKNEPWSSRRPPRRMCGYPRGLRGPCGFRDFSGEVFSVPGSE